MGLRINTNGASLSAQRNLSKATTKGGAAEGAADTEGGVTLLRGGGNDLRMKRLQKAGVDVTQRGTVQPVIDQLDELVTQMEAEAARIARADAAGN